MIYAAFTFWMLLMFFAGTGVYRLWTKLANPAWVNWALLPGTVVSQMAYIFGSLITGGEIRRAKLIAGGGSKTGSQDSQPATQPHACLKRVGPVVAAMFSIAACAAAILVAHWLLGKPVMKEFLTGGSSPAPATLPQELPTSWNALWDQVSRQVMLLRRMCETLGRVNWLSWPVPLFIYLSACLTIRLFPAGRPYRPTLAASAAIAATIALVGLIWRQLSGLMQSLWPLLTYLWASVMFLLVVTLLLLGVAWLIRALAGKTDR